ncbi:hypothetical protein U9M48_043650 [Paspalum notatum var. saurae]|uniref:Uncharacterized protein n=1 Tax=Paspalum notatum var. saurae TaxID=547442 RepID=A0AAQ3XFR5_PASNO
MTPTPAPHTSARPRTTCHLCPPRATCRPAAACRSPPARLRAPRSPLAAGAARTPRRRPNAAHAGAAHADARTLRLPAPHTSSWPPGQQHADAHAHAMVFVVCKKTCSLVPANSLVHIHGSKPTGYRLEMY